MRDDLTKKQLGPDGRPKWAVFLPAISGFYATFIGEQRQREYVDPARFPAGLTDMEQLNWLNKQKSLFPYKWSLHSAGHANLDLTKSDPTEDMLRQREKGTLLLGDSGGFQIAKGLWEGEWRDPNCQAVKKKMQDCVTRKSETRTVEVKDKSKKKVTKTVTVDLVKEYQKRIDSAQKQRKAVLTWLDDQADYSMTLDIPTWVMLDEHTRVATGITTHEEAVEATQYNNEYFIKHRRGVADGGTKILNVLQGSNHTDAESWYETMKGYCDPKKYPGKNFDGWAMGAQNMCDMELILKRIVTLRYDGLLQEGVHDWMHFLGTSKLEWAVLLTVIQKAVRKYVNPSFTISFDCASPFLATANGQVYYDNIHEPYGKWGYRMEATADDKKYALDTRKWSTAVVADGLHKTWKESPVSDMWKMKDICIYKPGVRNSSIPIEEFDFMNPDHYDVLPDKNKNDKWGKTSWDSFSYALLMAHNVWMHLTAVQEANQKFESGIRPAMLQQRGGDWDMFEDIVEAIFAAPTKEDSLAIITEYRPYWVQIIGTGRGSKGEKNWVVDHTVEVNLFTAESPEVIIDDEPEFDESKLEALDAKA